MIKIFKIKKWNNKSRLASLRGRSGQSLTEFVFVLPFIFMIMFAFVQFSVYLERKERTQMAVWTALRPMTIYSGNIIPTSKYGSGTVSDWIKHDYFAKNDIVDIKIDTGMIGLSVDSNIAGYTPFLYSGVEYELLQKVFTNIVVMKNNKKCLKTEKSGTILKWTVAG
jgi:hypothetical protein